jgi:molecular chaperone DnaK
MGFTAMNGFKDQLDAVEKDKVTKHITGLRGIAAKGQAGDGVALLMLFGRRSTRHSRRLDLFQKVGKRSLVSA